MDSRERVIRFSHYSEVDICMVAADQRGPYPSLASHKDLDGDSYDEIDSWGRLLRKKKSGYFELVQAVAVREKRKEPPFEAMDGNGQIPYEKVAPHPELAERCLVSGVLGLHMGCCRLFGEVDYLMALAEDEGYCKYLCERLSEHAFQIGVRVAGDTRTKDTALWIYDEMASTHRLMFSPNAFEQVYLPAYKKLIARFRAAGIQNIILHCDGNSTELLDLLMEAGFTGIQSLAPTTGMWLPDVKKKVGNRFVLIGGMCNIHTLVGGTRREIEKEADALLEAAAGGGVIIGTHSIGGDIPVKNYEIYDAFMRKHSK